MPMGTHAVLVYDSLENKHDVLFHYLKTGINKEALFYVCAEESPESIKLAMEMQGINVGRLIADRTLSIKNYDEVYIKNGKVDSPGIIDLFSAASWEYKNNGLKGIRAAGEMSCFFKEGKLKELMEYERSLDTSFSFPGKGICAYNLVEMGNSGNLDMLWPIIKAHGLVIMTGPRGGFALESSKLTERDVELARVPAMV